MMYVWGRRFLHAPLEETQAKREELKQMFTPEISGAEGQPIIKQSRVCYADRQHPGMVFLRLRQCLGCPFHGFPGASANYQPLLCTESAYCGPWNPVSVDPSQNPKRKVKKYDGPYRWLVTLPFLSWLHHVLSDSLDERCLKCMGQRKQFEYARHSEDGKEHLKNCKAEPKATKLTGTFAMSSRTLVCVVWDLICFVEGQAPALPPGQAPSYKRKRKQTESWLRRSLRLTVCCWLSPWVSLFSDATFPKLWFLNIHAWKFSTKTFK